MSKKLLILAVSALAIVLVASALSGCTTTNTPGTGTGASTGAGTGPSTTAVTGAPTLGTAGDKVTIAGSQDGTVDPKLETGGYIVEIRYMDEVEVDAGNYFVGATPNMFPAGPDGWHLSSDVANIQGGNLIKIKASSPYVVTLTRLPLAAQPDTTPKTYKGTGNSVVGPVSLSQGTVTMKGVSGDIKVQLYDATTGIFADFDKWLYKDANTPAEATMDVPNDGSYLIKVTIEEHGDWEFIVSQ